MNDSAVHHFQAPPVALITFSSGFSGPATRKFRVPIPDSRMRAKIGVLFVPDPGGLPDVAGGYGTHTLWLSEADKDRSVSGIAIPATNIEGTASAPTTIPATAGLGGYSREFVTAADFIDGTLTSTGGGPMLGTWILQVDLRPNAVRFTDDEWRKLIVRCSPYVLGGAAVGP